AGHDISLEDIPLDDPKAMEGLCRGETAGVFQLEGGMTTRMTTDVAPTAFEDIVALSALIRPGPMQMAPDYIARRHGRATTEYMHPLMEGILKETHGVPLYQEQVMQIANVVAGFSMAESDGLRKAMGKKLPAEMAKYRDRFIEGCRKNDIAGKLAGDIFDMIERFAGYGFPKAHSAAYGVITAQTAYLKANYPVEFMAALMSTEMGATDKTVFNVVECRRAGIPLLPPDVNRSHLDYSVEEFQGKQSIRFGLGAVKNVGLGAVESILTSRKGTIGQQFSSLEAFCDAVDWSAVNKRVAECLAKTGALDGFGERAAILASLEPLIGAAQQRQKAAARGQMDLFGGVPDIAPVGAPVRLADVPPADRKQLLAWEKELLGLYLSSHPLMDWTGNGAPEGRALLAEIGERAAGSRAHFIGMVTTIRRITTRNNRTMAVLEVEDLTGSIEVVAFPDTYEQYSDVISEDAILDIQAKVDERGEKKQLILEQATAELPRPKMLERARPLVIIVLPSSAELWQDINAMQKVDDLLRRHEGPNPVEFHISAGTDVLRLRSRTRCVEWTTELERDLGDVLGANGVFLTEPAPVTVNQEEGIDPSEPPIDEDVGLRDVA
ncbi:MAG: DNA polymerase III subunit alpha, partial [Thermomicrobiales bacterium]